MLTYLVLALFLYPFKEKSLDRFPPPLVLGSLETEARSYNKSYQ